MDTMPEKLPSGIDSAVAILSPCGTKLLEDGGEDYQERWERVCSGDAVVVLQARPDHVHLAAGMVQIEVTRSDMHGMLARFFDGDKEVYASVG